MHPSLVVWDLETVPDLAGFAAANDLVGKPDADIRAELGNKFPKHIYHTILCPRLVATAEEARLSFYENFQLLNQTSPQTERADLLARAKTWELLADHIQPASSVFNELG
jgi:hypothetical protein